jgi:hypothetical protein
MMIEEAFKVQANGRTRKLMEEGPWQPVLATQARVIDLNKRPNHSFLVSVSGGLIAGRPESRQTRGGGRRGWRWMMEQWTPLGGKPL